MATPSAALPDLTGRFVLVVDDHQDTLELARIILELAGAKVSTCHTAETAIAELAAAVFDVIITDLSFGPERMAGTRILEVAQRSPSPGVVIALTGRKEAAAQLLARGFDAVIIKPVDPFELVDAVADALRNR